MNFTEHLIDISACPEAIEWSRSYPALAEAWAACPRGDWLLWYAARRSTDRRLLVTAACACARTVLHLVRAGEDRPRRAIETAEAWARGEATIEQVRAAASAAYAADAYADAAYAAAYAAASRAAADAADTPASRAAAYAADTTATAAYAAQAAAYAAYAEKPSHLADLVRSIVPCPGAP